MPCVHASQRLIFASPPIHLSPYIREAGRRPAQRAAFRCSLCHRLTSEKPWGWHSGSNGTNGSWDTAFHLCSLAARYEEQKKKSESPNLWTLCCCNWPFALPTYLQASPQPYSQFVKDLLELKGRVTKQAMWFRVEMQCAGLYWNCILPSNSPVWGPLLYGWPKEPTEDSKSMDLSAQGLQKLRSHRLLWSWNRQDSAQPHAGKGNLSKRVISYPPNPEMRWTNWLFRRNGASNAHSSIDNTHISCQLVLES